MYGSEPKGRPIIYRCTTTAHQGASACGNHQIREDVILPFILKMLGEEVNKLAELDTPCPEELAAPWLLLFFRNQSLPTSHATVEVPLAKFSEKQK